MRRDEIHIRDPFVLVHDGKYYMYGTRGETCWGEADGFDVFVGRDLESWEGPFEVFHNDGSFWANRDYWAPEVHLYAGMFYMFASFKKDGVCRGTQILRSASPTGQFLPYSDGVVTPKDWECLDGTLYVSKAQKPYMVFCREWLQVHDGEIWGVPLRNDLKTADGEPFLLLKASQQPGASSENGLDYVTDGPFLFRLSDGTLAMIWSTFGSQGYCVAVAYSENGEIDGKWNLSKDLLFEKNGGHGMIFSDLQNQRYITFHEPNDSKLERPSFYKLQERSKRLCLQTE